jgi:hypothetical protein
VTGTFGSTLAYSFGSQNACDNPMTPLHAPVQFWADSRSVAKVTENKIFFASPEPNGICRIDDIEGAFNGCEGGAARGSVRMHIISLQQRSLMQGVAGGLRAEFATVLRMPVPDRLATLMRRLDIDLGPSARRGGVHAQSRAKPVIQP